MRKKVKGVVYSEKMRNLPEIFSAVAALGERAIGRIVVLGSYLKNCRNALGHLSDVPAVAKELCVRTSTLTKWMEECGIYVIDHENGMFYYPRYRTLFRLPPHPTDEEIRQFRDCSADYGYLSATDAKRAEKARGEGRKAAVKDEGNAAENDLEMIPNY